MKQYMVTFGKMVPYKCQSFSSWAGATKFMKTCLDDGQPVHSVSKEYVSPEWIDERDRLVQSVDIIRDR